MNVEVVTMGQDEHWIYSIFKKSRETVAEDSFSHSGPISDIASEDVLVMIDCCLKWPNGLFLEIVS